MIRLVFDAHALTERKGKDVVVSKTDEFVASRLAIREALRNQRSLEVIVTNPRAVAWYESLRDYPGVTFAEVTPHGELRRRLSKYFRDDLTMPLADRDIADLRLIELAQSSPPSTVLTSEEDLKSWTLSVCVDPVWGRASGSPTHAAELATHFLAHGDVKSGPAIERFKSERRQSWTACPIGKVYHWLLERPVERAFLLYVWQVSQGYSKTMRDKVLKEFSRSAGQELNNMAGLLGSVGMVACSDGYIPKGDFSRRLELLWKSALKEHLGKSTGGDGGGTFKEIVSAGLEQMSGLMQGELDALKWFAGQHTEFVSREMCDLVAAKFGWAGAQLDEVRNLVPPSYPAAPDKNWDWSAIKGWVVRQYFPYRKWLLARGKQDRRVDEMADVCSLWIYEHYPMLKNDLDPLVYGTWSRIQALVRDGRQVLWIVIDNLAGLWIDDVVRAFAGKGFHLCSDAEWRIAMLPSETATSKSALIAGRLPNQIPYDAFQKYPRLFAEACKDRGVSGKYVPADGLKEGRLAGDQVTCWVTNKLDTKSHEGFFDLEVDVAHFLGTIAGHVRRFVPEDASVDRFRLIVSTDHGSCYVPRGSASVPLPKGMAVPSHSRYIETLVPMQLDDRWLELDPDKYALHGNVAVARGYAYIGKKPPAGLTHGGLTPEEVVIPHLEFAMQKIEPIMVECKHMGESIMGTRKGKVEFRLSNFNDVQVTDVLASFASHSLEISATCIPAMDVVSTECELRLTPVELARSKDNVVVLKGLCSFRCRGEAVRGSIEVAVHVKRIMEGPSEAEQLLGL